MTKYTRCCDRVCLVAKCKHREEGGCIHVCNLKDAESLIVGLLDGKMYRHGNGVIFEPGRKNELSEEDREREMKNLDAIRNKLEDYLIKD